MIPRTHSGNWSFILIQLYFKKGTGMKKIKNTGFKFERWELIHKSKIQRLKLKSGSIIKILLENRRIRIDKERKEYFKPISPEKLSIRELGLDRREIGKAVERLRIAKRNKEKKIIYGDNNRDGISPGAIMWGNLFSL